MSGMHKRREMKRTFTGYPLVHGSRLFAAVDDAQHLRLLAKSIRKLLVAQLLEVAVCHTAEFLRKLNCIGHYLMDFAPAL